MVRLLPLTLLVAACGSAVVGPEDPPVDPGETTTAAPAGTTATTTTDPPATTTTQAGLPDHDRPAAPDFTLRLGEGGEYTLSEGARPVYLVFWAEW